MTTTTEMAELDTLWDMVDSVRLTEQQDEIQWRWTGDGKYTARSAYIAQFTSSSALLTATQSGLLRQRGNIDFLLGC